MNKAILVGRLTRDPEVRYSQDENAPDLYSLFRTVLAHDGGATGASCSCGTHIEQRSRPSLRGSRADVAEMQHTACSLLEVLSGNELTCDNGLLAITVELQHCFYWTSNPILDVR